MRGKKTPIDIKAKIIESKINNPSKSSRDIASEFNWVVSNDTICDILNDDLPQVATESQRIASLIDTNNNLQSLADERLKEMLADWEETIRISELVQVRESTFKQNQLLTWKSTENNSIEIIFKN